MVTTSKWHTANTTGVSCIQLSVKLLNRKSSASYPITKFVAHARTHSYNFFPDRQCITLLLQLLTASAVVENCTLYVNFTILYHYTKILCGVSQKPSNPSYEIVCVCVCVSSPSFNVHTPLSSSSPSPPTFVVEENSLTENRNDKKCYYWLFSIDSIILNMM